MLDGSAQSLALLAGPVREQMLLHNCPGNVPCYMLHHLLAI